MYVADVSTVAASVLNQIFSVDGISPFVSVAKGMPAPIFWDLVNKELEVPCQPMPWDEWAERALSSMAEIGDTHPLWPVQHFLGQLGTVRAAEEIAASPTGEDQHLAVTSSVRYLRSINFIESSAQDLGKVQRASTFKRMHM